MKTLAQRSFVLLMALVGGAGIAAAQVVVEPPPIVEPPAIGQPQAAAHRLDAFVGQNTAAVGHLDLSQTNFQATQDWLSKVIAAAIPNQADAKQMQDALTRSSATAKDWAQQMQKAGASDLYVVLRTPAPGQDQQNQMPFGAVIVPTDAGDNTQAIQDLLTPKDQANGPAEHRMTTAVINNAVVCAPQKHMDEFRNLKPVNVPAMTDALKSLQDSAIKLAILPTEALRQQITNLADSMQQQQPQQAADLREAAKQIKWIALGLNSPPKGSFDVIVQATDAQSAQKLQAQFNQALKQLANDQQVKRLAPNAQQDIDLLKPEVKNDRVVLHLSGEQLDKIVMNDLVPAVRTMSIQQNQQHQEQPRD